MSLLLSIILNPTRFVLGSIVYATCVILYIYWMESPSSWTLFYWANDELNEHLPFSHFIRDWNESSSYVSCDYSHHSISVCCNPSNVAICGSVDDNFIFSRCHLCHGTLFWSVFVCPLSIDKSLCIYELSRVQVEVPRFVIRSDRASACKKIVIFFIFTQLNWWISIHSFSFDMIFVAENVMANGFRILRYAYDIRWRQWQHSTHDDDDDGIRSEATENPFFYWNEIRNNTLMRMNEHDDVDGHRAIATNVILHWASTKQRHVERQSEFEWEKGSSLFGVQMKSFHSDRLDASVQVQIEWFVNFSSSNIEYLNASEKISWAPEKF